MKKCNKFIDSLIPYYNSPDLISAEEVGIRKGWKASLEWVLSNLDGKTDILELGLRIREERDYE